MLLSPETYAAARRRVDSLLTGPAACAAPAIRTALEGLDPDTGIPLVGYQLPMIEEAKAMACEAAREIPEVGHVGWDMAIGPDGPAIIEGNDFPGTDLCQLAPFCPEKTGLWPYYKELLHL